MSKSMSSPWPEHTKKTMIPHWWVNLHEFVGDCGPKYYKVNYIQIDPYHDGYCSDGYGGNDVEWRESNNTGYLPFEKWDFDTKNFTLIGASRCIEDDDSKVYKSGYCGLWSKIKLQCVELITNETPS